MTVTERLRLEVLIREQHSKHGDEFYVELANILQKVQDEVSSEVRAINPRTREVIYR